MAELGGLTVAYNVKMLTLQNVPGLLREVAEFLRYDRRYAVQLPDRLGKQSCSMPRLGCVHFRRSYGDATAICK